MTNSRLSGFYNLSIEQRRAKLAESAALPAELLSAYDAGALTPDAADHMVENAIGTYALPLGVGLNFRVNGRDLLVPMAIEEPSVIAGAHPSRFHQLLEARFPFLIADTARKRSH